MRVLRIATVAIGVLFALIIVAVAIVAVTFDPNDYKDYAQTWVEDQTGRSLTIDGDIELSVFPWLAVETGHLELGNAPGFGEEPFVAAQRVSARVRLLPLIMRREFEIGTVSIDGLELDLAVADDGTTNWSDLLGQDVADSSNAQDPAEQSNSSADLASLGVEGIELRGARVVWRENNAPRYIVSELSLATGSVAPATPTDITLEADLLDVATQRTVHVALATNAAAETNGVVNATGSSVEFRIGDSSGNMDAEGEAQIDSLEFVPGTRLLTGPVQLTNTVDSPLRAGAALASDIAWSALDVDLATMNVSVDDLVAEANGVRASLQLVGEDLAGESAVLRGSIVIDESPASAVFELAGLDTPSDVDASELGNFSGSTAFVLEQSSGDIELSNVAVTMLGVDLRAQQAVLRGDIFSAELDVAPFRPSAALRRIVEPGVPEEIDLEQIGTIAFSARVFGTPQNISITGMRLAALNAEFTGQLQLEPLADGINVSGDVSSNRFATNEIFAVAGALMPESISPETIGTVAATGEFDWDAGSRAATARSLRLEAFGMNGTGDLIISNFGSATTVSGNIQVGDFDPRELLSRFSLAVPQTSDETALRRASINSQFEISQSAAAFEALTVNLDDSRITGSFEVSEFDDPFYRFTLTADQLNADRYLPPQTAPGADDSAATDTDERRAGDIELSNDALSAINIDANVRVGQLQLAGMDFSNVATSMVVGDGRMLLDSAHADLYGGSFDGRFHVDASSDVPSMMLQGNAVNMQLTPLITALADSANFSGAGSFEINLTGRGPTITDNLRSATGTMGFELLSGTIEGFNVDKSLCRAFNSVRGNAAPRDVPDRSDYEFIRGSANVTDGIAASSDLVANIGSVQVRGSGTLALADQVIDYDLEARLARAVQIPGCEEMERIVGNDFPLEVSGPLTSPNIAPDYNEVIRRILEYRLREEVRDRLLESIFD